MNAMDAENTRSHDIAYKTWTLVAGDSERDNSVGNEDRVFLQLIKTLYSVSSVLFSLVEKSKKKVNSHTNRESSRSKEKAKLALPQKQSLPLHPPPPL